MALRYVRGEDLRIYGSGGRGSSGAGNSGSQAWRGLRGQGRAQVSGGSRPGSPIYMDTAQGRGSWVSLRISLLKGP